MTMVEHLVINRNSGRRGISGYVHRNDLQRFVLTERDRKFTKPVFMPKYLVVEDHIKM